MKKIGIVFFVLLFTGLLMACTSQGTANTTSTPGVANTASPDQTASTIDGTDPSAALPEQVLYEENNILIKANSLSDDETKGPTVALYIENNTDKRIGLRPYDASVNGYMVTPLINVVVDSGTVADASLCFVLDELEACGIETVTDISLWLSVYDVDDYEELYDIGPIVFSTSAAEAFAQVRDDAGDVVFDEADVKIVYKEAQTNILGPAYSFYIENNTDKRISVQARDVIVNEEDVTPVFNCIIMPGKAILHPMVFKSADLSESEIEKILEIQLEFVIYDTDGFNDIAISDEIVITP